MFSPGIFSTLKYLCCFFVIVHSEQLIPDASRQYYELLSKVTIKELHHVSTQETSYTLKSKLQINSVWNLEKEKLLQVYLTESTVSAPSANTNQKQLIQEITKIPDRPFYISLINGGIPNKVIAHTSRDQSLLNLERGIASLLQIRYTDGPVTEIDVSGQCNAFYAIKSSTRIEKIKTDCSHWDLKVNYRSEKPLNVLQHSRETVHFDLSADGRLLKAESLESHHIALEAKPDVGSQVESQLVLKHIAVGEGDAEQLNYDTLDEAIKSLLEWYRIFDVEADVDGAISEIKDTTLKQQIKKHAEQLQDENIGKQTLATLFAELIPLARITKKAEFVEILQSHKILQGQLVDLLGSVQTIEAHLAINETFNYHSEDIANIELLEKYLQSLAIGTHPERAIIEELFQLLQTNSVKNKKLLDTIIQTVAALAKQSGFDPNDPILSNIRTYLVEQLTSKCTDVDCKTIYIRALQNLQDSNTIPILLKHALEGDIKISVASMQALKIFPNVNYHEEHRKAFTEIFYQLKRKYDSSARTFALDILLSLKPTKQQLGELLNYLYSNDHHFEIKTYVIQKLRMLAEKCPRFRALLVACLSERPQVNNYDIIAQKGLTTVLTRQLSMAPAFNESLLSVQEIYQGVLKRGSVELILSAGREETSTFRLGIFTSGLSHFVDDSGDTADADEADDSPSTAGMEITVQGILLRPLVFFNGQTELMGHIWSGTASDPTPAFQATTLAQDYEHYVILSSGATVYMRILGCTSIDLNGKVEFSLWNRNANTEIHQNSGIGIVGQTIVGFTYAKLESKFVLSYEPRISLQADISFYSGIQLCMQLQRPEVLLKLSTTKSVTLSATKPYTKSVKTKYTHKSPGRTLALNQKNNEMCNIIFS